MKEKSKYFVGLITLLIGLILFTIFSIIFCVINSSLVPQDKSIEHALAFGYLFIHLIIVMAVLYLALKSYFVKDSLLSVIMTLENGKRNDYAYRNALIISIVFSLIGIYFFLNAFGIIHVMSFFSLGLNVALCNVNLSIGLVALYVYFYKPAEVKNSD